MATIGGKKVSWGGVAPHKTASREVILGATPAPGAMPPHLNPPRAERQEPAAAPQTAAPQTVRRAATNRIRMTANGPVRLTPTEALIVEFIGRHEGRPCSKAQIAAALGRNEKTVARLLSHMRKMGILTSETIYADNGAQLANAYRLVDEVSISLVN